MTERHQVVGSVAAGLSEGLRASAHGTAEVLAPRVHYAVVDSADGRVVSVGYVDFGLRGHVLALDGHVAIPEAHFHTLDRATAPHRLVDGAPTPIPPPPPSDEDLAAAARRDRSRRLTATDWMVQPDVPASDQVRTARLAYRQSLRDITSQAGFPGKVDWPTAP